MDDDDLALQHVEAKFTPQNLAAMSVAAIEEYIALLEGEIARARDAITERESAKTSADSVFKT